MMKIEVKAANALKQKTVCLTLGVFDGRLSPQLREVDKLLGGALTNARRDQEFRGKAGETLLLTSAGQLPARRVLLVGLGKAAQVDREGLRRAAAKMVRIVQQQRLGSVVTDLTTLGPAGLATADCAAAVVEGACLANYRFDRYRTEQRDTLPPELTCMTLLASQPAQLAALTAGAERATLLCRGVTLARDLVNEPGNIKSPEFLAQTAITIAAETGMRCTVLDRAQLAAEGLGALLAVAQGSSREPRLITLEYRGGGDARPVALIGKGVVFDAGGISLKPAEKMDEMKMDMGGAAAVLGTLLVAALLKLPLNLIGVIPAVENMPSGSAMRPGDIITSLSGKTIEVLNTDAEGRLILADALTWVERYDPLAIVDLATLTGASIIALGHHATALLGNNDRLARALIKAGEISGERLWQLPLWDDYSKQLKSEVADLKNTGGRPAGTITAAAFLSNFVGERPWAHLDIAGTAWAEKATDSTQGGGTGVGVRLLVEYLASLG